MKKIFKYSLFALTGLFLAACNEDYKDWASPMSYPQEDAVNIPSITATANADLIDLETADATIQLLNIAGGSEAIVLKNLQFVPLGADGQELRDFAMTALNATGQFSKSALTNLVRGIYGKKREQRDIAGNVYVNATVEGFSEATLVNAGTAVIKVIMPDPGYENFYLVGTPNGWNNNTKGTYMIPSEKGVYSFTTYYTGAWDLKFIAEDNLGSWDVLWGGIDGDKSPSGTLFEENAGAIASPEAGYYTFTANMNTSTYTWTLIDNQAPAEYSSMGVIGGFNGWGGDVEMEQAAPHFWYVEYTITEDTELKFRANGGWDVNWGTGITISDDQFYGVAVGGGDNIKVPAGTYAFYLNDITGEFAILAQ